MTLISVRLVLTWEFDGSGCAGSASIFSNCFRPWTEYKLCEGRNHAYLGYSCMSLSFQFSSVAQSLFATPWTAAYQASLSITDSWSLLKLMSIELVMPSNHLIICCPLLLPPSILPSIRVFSNESVLRVRWPKYWSFSFSISPSNEYSGLISLELTNLISL